MFKQLPFKNAIYSQLNLFKLQTIDLHRLIDLLLLMILSGPAILIVGLIYVEFLIVHKRSFSFFYKGERLGRHKTPFQIYKIRTLKPGSAEKLKGKVLPVNNGLELPFGKFLRHTRLDELPQFINIFNGEMSFFGPRPVRREIYFENRGQIVRYEKRFRVKPGLLGPSQIILPHSAPKKIRARINNLYIDSNKKIQTNMWLLWLAIKSLPLNFLKQLYYLFKLKIAIYSATGSFKNRRRSMRFENKKQEIQTMVFIEKGKKGVPINLLNINKNAILIDGLNERLRRNQSIKLQFDVHVKKSKKTIRCSGTVMRKLPSHVTGKEFDQYVVKYKPVSSFNNYLIDQYILKQSIMSSAT